MKILGKFLFLDFSVPSTNLFVLADLLVLFAGESRVGYVVMHWTLKPDRFQ